MFPQVLAFAVARDFDCIPGFQQKIFYIEQPLEFLEDQLVLNGRNSLVDFFLGGCSRQGAHNLSEAGAKQRDIFICSSMERMRFFSFIKVCMFRTLAIHFIFKVEALPKLFSFGFGGRFGAFCKLFYCCLSLCTSFPFPLMGLQ